MKTTPTRVLAALSLVLASAQAGAIPVLRMVTPTFYQSGGSASLNAGLLVEASTDLLVLVIGGGFTITCSTSALPQTAERRATYSDFFGPRAVLRIPDVVPSTYTIPNWATVPPRSCAQCVMQYKGEARDETSLSIRVGNAGVGASFTLIPAGEQSASNAVLTDVCRPMRNECCTPLCAIP